MSLGWVATLIYIDRGGLTGRKSHAVRGLDIPNYVFNVQGAHRPAPVRTPR